MHAPSPVFIVSRDTMKTSAPKSKLLDIALAKDQNYNDDLYLVDICLDFLQINLEAIERSSLVYVNDSENWYCLSKFSMKSIDGNFSVLIDALTKEFGISFIRQYKRIDQLCNFESDKQQVHFEKHFSYFVSLISVCDICQHILHIFYAEKIV